MNSRSSQFANSVVVAMKGCSRSLAVLCVFLLGMSFHAFAQEATILGTVTDPSGSVVPNVKIRIIHVETNEVRNVVTNDVGQYVAAACLLATITSPPKRRASRWRTTTTWR